MEAQINAEGCIAATVSMAMQTHATVKATNATVANQGSETMNIVTGWSL